MTRARAAVAVAALVLATASACTSEHDDDGVVADASPAVVSGTALWAQLPTGRLTVTVGAAVRTIPGAEVIGGRPIEAGDGRAFVPVELAYDDRAGVPWNAPLGSRKTADPAALSTVTLVLGDDAHRLAFPRVADRWYVETTVRDADRQPELRVAFDGVEQTVDAAGRRTTGEAAGLYTASTRRELVSCGRHDATRPKGAPRALGRSCAYDLWEFPWLAGRGWAADPRPGTTWVVATGDVWLRADELRDGVEACAPEDLTGSLRLRVDDTDLTDDLVHEVLRPPGFGRLTAQDAFLLPTAPEHRLELTSSWRCRIGDRTVERSDVDRATAQPLR